MSFKDFISEKAEKDLSVANAFTDGKAAGRKGKNKNPNKKGSKEFEAYEKGFKECKPSGKPNVGGKLDEKTKTNGGHGYFETFIDHPKSGNIINDLIKSVKVFIKDSEEYADEEGVSKMKQKENIIDDIVSGLYLKFGGK